MDDQIINEIIEGPVNNTRHALDGKIEIWDKTFKQLIEIKREQAKLHIEMAEFMQTERDENNPQDIRRTKGFNNSFELLENLRKLTINFLDLIRLEIISESMHLQPSLHYHRT